ncbi:MAG: hypothetical protein LBI30_01925 [Holosporales bacterium]|jgi:hypothetical protein|nr:hypothetical protein [Holosporales bacterium]
MPLASGRSFAGVEHAEDRKHFLPLNFELNRLIYHDLVSSSSEVADMFQIATKSWLDANIDQNNPSVMDLHGYFTKYPEFAKFMIETKKRADNTTLMTFLISHIISHSSCEHGLLLDGRSIGIVARDFPSFVKSPSDSSEFSAVLMDLLIVLNPYRPGFKLASFYSCPNARLRFGRTVKSLASIDSTAPSDLFFYVKDSDLVTSPSKLTDLTDDIRSLTMDALAEMEFREIQAEREREIADANGVLVNTLETAETGQDHWIKAALAFFESNFHEDLSAVSSNILLIMATTNKLFAVPMVNCVCSLQRQNFLRNPSVHTMLKDIRLVAGADYFPPLFVMTLFNRNPAVFRMLMETFHPPLDQLTVCLRTSKTDHCAVFWPCAELPQEDDGFIYEPKTWLYAAIYTKRKTNEDYDVGMGPEDEDIAALSIKYGGPLLVNATKGDSMPLLFSALLYSSQYLNFFLNKTPIDLTIKYRGLSLVSHAASLMLSFRGNEAVNSLIIERMRVLFGYSNVKIDALTFLTITSDDLFPASCVMLSAMIERGRERELLGALTAAADLASEHPTSTIALTRNKIVKERSKIGLGYAVTLLEGIRSEVLPGAEKKELKALRSERADPKVKMAGLQNSHKIGREILDLQIKTIRSELEKAESVPEEKP